MICFFFEKKGIPNKEQGVLICEVFFFWTFRKIQNSTFHDRYSKFFRIPCLILVVSMSNPFRIQRLALLGIERIMNKEMNNEHASTCWSQPCATAQQPEQGMQIFEVVDLRGRNVTSFLIVDFAYELFEGRLKEYRVTNNEV